MPEETPPKKEETSPPKQGWLRRNRMMLGAGAATLVAGGVVVPPALEHRAEMRRKAEKQRQDDLGAMSDTFNAHAMTEWARTGQKPQGWDIPEATPEQGDLKTVLGERIRNYYREYKQFYKDRLDQGLDKDKHAPGADEPSLQPLLDALKAEDYARARILWDIAMRLKEDRSQPMKTTTSRNGVTRYDRIAEQDFIGMALFALNNVHQQQQMEKNPAAFFAQLKSDLEPYDALLIKLADLEAETFRRNIEHNKDQGQKQEKGEEAAQEKPPGDISLKIKAMAEGRKLSGMVSGDDGIEALHAKLRQANARLMECKALYDKGKPHEKKLLTKSITTLHGEALQANATVTYRIQDVEQMLQCLTQHGLAPGNVQKLPQPIAPDVMQAEVRYASLRGRLEALKATPPPMLNTIIDRDTIAK